MGHIADAIAPTEETKELAISVSDAISPTDFILGTKVQPIKAHSMTQVPLVKVTGHDKIFSKLV